MMQRTQSFRTRRSTHRPRFQWALAAGLALSAALGLFNPGRTTAGDDLGSTSSGDVLDKLQALDLKPDNSEAVGSTFPEASDFEFLTAIAFERIAASDELPEFIQVTGTLWPRIKFELRLPTQGWNGKFYMAGCGGFCGQVVTDRVGFTNNLNYGLKRGYAAATTDSGHEGVASTDGRWAENNRRAEIDWAYRAIHEVARVSKALIQLAYRRVPKFSYFAGCSTGGRQAVMEALRYPNDFDGLISGAPALDYTGLVATWMSWMVQANLDELANPIINAELLGTIQQTVLAQCDGIDGLEDGIIADPRRCRVDFQTLGLSEAQLAALNKFYAKPTNSLGKPLYAGSVPYGSEKYWLLWLPGFRLPGTNTGGLIEDFNINFLDYMAFKDDPVGHPDWDPYAFDFDTHPQLLDFMGAIHNANKPNLAAFRNAGGKLIMYHGWADAIVPPTYTIDYYERVAAHLGGLKSTQDFFRLFLVPGMDHCSVQVIDGYDDFDMLTALENWVERNSAPEMILANQVATDGGTLRTRPLYPYPLFPNYVGGDPDLAQSFAPANDNTVRWGRFADDTFYAFESPAFEHNPAKEGEGLHHFYPYNFNLKPGTYDWKVQSPSMLGDEASSGFTGTFVVETAIPPLARASLTGAFPSERLRWTLLPEQDANASFLFNFLNATFWECTPPQSDQRAHKNADAALGLPDARRYPSGGHEGGLHPKNLHRRPHDTAAENTPLVRQHRLSPL
ncbi:MAG: tannase/feruloyl esterase family alpha/beta hydrolase [Gammaproteobacteria bacterium]